MCNELYEQICQVAQRSAERVVDLLCAGVGRDLGGQARQQPSQRLRTMTLQREEVLELAYDPFYDLALARGPAPIGLRPRPAGVVFRGGRNERSVKLHPQPLPLEPREALVGQVRSVAVGSYEGVAYGPLVGGRDGQPESGDHPLGVNHEGHLEAVYPLGLGGAASEACLAGEKPLARSPHPHDGRDEGSVHHAVDRRRFRKILGESPLQEAQLWLQGSNAPVELALGAQHREVGAQVRPREAPEVALAAKARPLGEDRQGKDLRSGSLRRAGRPGRRVAEGWSAFHQSSIWTYNETKKESRSTMGHRLWEKVRCQHKVSAPSSSSAITHQPSKVLSADPNHQLRWLGHLFVPGLFDGEHSFVIRSLEEDEVRFVQREAFSGLLVPLFARSLENSTLRGFEEMNRTLKERAEAATRGD